MPSEEELLTRQMPHSTEAEQSVLGSMLIDARCVPEEMCIRDRNFSHDRSTSKSFSRGAFLSRAAR